MVFLTTFLLERVSSLFLAENQTHPFKEYSSRFVLYAKPIFSYISQSNPPPSPSTSLRTGRLIPSFPVAKVCRKQRNKNPTLINQLFRVLGDNGFLFTNLLIHDRLCEVGIVTLVVTVLTVTHQINHNILLKLVTVL